MRSRPAYIYLLHDRRTIFWPSIGFWRNWGKRRRRRDSKPDPNRSLPINSFGLISPLSLEIPSFPPFILRATTILVNIPLLPLPPLLPLLPPPPLPPSWTPDETSWKEKTWMKSFPRAKRNWNSPILLFVKKRYFSRRRSSSFVAALTRLSKISTFYSRCRLPPLPLPLPLPHPPPPKEIRMHLDTTSIFASTP